MVVWRVGQPDFIPSCTSLQAQQYKGRRSRLWSACCHAAQRVFRRWGDISEGSHHCLFRNTDPSVAAGPERLHLEALLQGQRSVLLNLSDKVCMSTESSLMWARTKEHAPFVTFILALAAGEKWWSFKHLKWREYYEEDSFSSLLIAETTQDMSGF